MLWTTLRLNWGNTSAIAALCLLPVLTFGDANSNDKSFGSTTPFTELQSSDVKLIMPLVQNAFRARHISTADCLSLGDHFFASKLN